MPILRLAVLPVLDLHPRRRFRPVRRGLQLRDDAFEILLADRPEELHAALLNVGDVQQSRRLRRHERLENLLALDQRLLPKVAPVQPEVIEGIVVRFLAPVQQRVEPGVAGVVQADGFAIQDGPVGAEGAGEVVA